MLRLKQTDSGDLDLSTPGPVLVSGEESAKAAVYNVLSVQAQDESEGSADDLPETIEGEWPFNKTFGLRWRGVILRKYFEDPEARAIIADALNTISDLQIVSPSQITLDLTSGENPEQRRVEILVSDVRLANGDVVPSITVVTI